MGGSNAGGAWPRAMTKLHAYQRSEGISKNRGGDLGSVEADWTSCAPAVILPAILPFACFREDGPR